MPASSSPQSGHCRVGLGQETANAEVDGAPIRVELVSITLLLNRGRTKMSSSNNETTNNQNTNVG